MIWMVSDSDIRGHQRLLKESRESLRDFFRKPPGSDDGYYVRSLIDRQHVVEYSIVQDRGCNLSRISLAIGQHYFGPADFWSFEASARFKMKTSTDAVQHNLELLDEFFGYPDAFKHSGDLKEISEVR